MEVLKIEIFKKIPQTFYMNWFFMSIVFFIIFIIFFIKMFFLK